MMTPLRSAEQASQVPVNMEVDRLFQQRLAHSGHAAQSLPAMNHTALKHAQVVVPEGCIPGQQVIFTTSEGEELLVTMNEQMLPGSLITLQYHGTVPLPQVALHPSAPLQVAPAPSHELASTTPPLRTNGRQVQLAPQPPLTEDARRRRRQQRRKADERARRCGQCLYLGGWLLLPVFGLGLLLWLVAACQYYAKTRRQRKVFPQQSVTACLSLVTLLMVVVTLGATVVLLQLHPVEAHSEVATNTNIENPAAKSILRVMNTMAEKFRALKQAHHQRWTTIQVVEEGHASPLITASLSSNKFLGKPVQRARTLPMMAIRFQ